MSKSVLEKTYESGNFEDSIYKAWEESGFFNPDTLPGKRPKSFSISMPPPNATGHLHTGHAVMLAIQDLVIRYQRMLGKKTLWVPGTDHAAIATQNKVEKIIKAESGKTRHDLGRDAFLKRVNEFVSQSQSNIKKQVRKMGSSCDWSRERYTLDAGLTTAVNHAFLEMYNDGLIYRGYRIVNWCPRCKSTLADDEVEYQEEKTKFYYFKYGPVTIGTARPETKFGDKIIIVHPKDPRYKDMIGKEFAVEWILGPINAKVVADEAADMDMGSGAMTITPAHSFVDFDLAQKHGFAIEKIIDEDGKITEAGGKDFVGMDVKAARQKVVEILQRKGLVERIDDNYVHNLSVCYRCGTPIEPLPSKQWFVNVNQPIKKFGGKSIKQRSVEVLKKHEIKIIPDRFEKIYFHWMENLRDWCISRQIWFGHRIPVWYKGEEIFVGTQAPQGDGWQQDPDTLDTWFSSGLWTFSTLGWPQATKELKTFHPTSLMETGYDILFFWVARMIIMSTYLMEEVPFKEVYLHGLIRDEQGRKMSKSLDNTIDPLDVIAKFGADAVRLSLLIGVTPGNDMNLSEAKIGGYRNFVNKLWNISRYILMNTENPRLITAAPKAKTLADKWILSELNALVGFVTKQLEQYNLSAAGEKIYEFTWSKLADWYLEIAKVEGNKESLLLYILQTLLKLWHPFTPFVTEVIWKEFHAESMLIVESWPKARSTDDKKTAKEFELIKNTISAIRNLRSESNIPPSQYISAVIIAGTHKALFERQSELICKLARLESLAIVAKGKKVSGSLSTLVGAIEIYLPVADTLDVAKEIARLTKEEARIAEFVNHLKDKLKNERFLERAPHDIIEKEKAKLADHQEQLIKIRQQLKSLQV